MSLVYRPLMQGIVAGGAAAYLYDKTKAEAHQNTSNTWMSMALQVNHLLLLAAENVALLGSPMGAFGSLVRAAPVLAPIAAAVTMYTKDKGMPFKAEHIQQFNTVYRVGVVVSSCASLVLGNPIFAAASLTMLAVDTISTGKSKEVFDIAKKVAGAAAFVGYGMQIFTSEKVSALVAKVSTFLTGTKLFFDAIPESNEEAQTISSSDDDTSEVGCHSCCRHSHSDRSDSHSDSDSDDSIRLIETPLSPEASGSGNVFTRGSVW
jgi:hypothetical protein